MEEELYQSTYATAANWCHNNFILCNDIASLDPSVDNNARFDWEDENGKEIEILSYFLTDAKESDVKYLEKNFPSLLFSYSDLLGLYVLCVDHWGTNWNYVPCKTTNPNAACKEGETIN